MLLSTHAVRISLVAAALAPSLAYGYSTKLHMLTGAHIADMLKNNGCKLTLGGWNKVTAVTDKYGRKSTLDLRVDPKKVGAESGWVKPDKSDIDNPTKVLDLSGEICNLITNPATRQYFVSATTGPDTFPGMFGNTDPTHALVWNTSWQIAVLWQNARTPEEKAFAHRRRDLLREVPDAVPAKLRQPIEMAESVRQEDVL